MARKRKSVGESVKDIVSTQATEIIVKENKMTDKLPKIRVTKDVAGYQHTEGVTFFLDKNEDVNRIELVTNLKDGKWVSFSVDECGGNRTKINLVYQDVQAILRAYARATGLIKGWWMEFGLHLVEDPQGHMGTYGAVASYTTNEKYRQYVKFNGYNAIRYVKAGKEFIKSNGGVPDEKAEAFHNWADVILLGETNFNLKIPYNLKYNKGIETNPSWIDTIFQGWVEEDREKAQADYETRRGKRMDAKYSYEKSKKLDPEPVVKAGKLIVKSHKDGSDIDVMTIPAGTHLFPFKAGVDQVAIKWDPDNKNSIQMVLERLNQNCTFSL